jgi:predicted RNA binding protein YcfA (HicA-like mRNA interferase family)
VYNIKDVKLYFMTSREIIKLLQDNGWVIERVRGSHHVMSHPDNPKLVVVPHPRKDFPIGTLRSIERVSGVKLR